MIKKKYKGDGKVFVDARGLTEILPFGAQIVRKKLDRRIIDRDKLIFKGEDGYQIAPHGCRVLVVVPSRTCRCSGKCDGCKRRENRDHDKEGEPAGGTCRSV